MVAHHTDKDGVIQDDNDESPAAAVLQVSTVAAEPLVQGNDSLEAETNNDNVPQRQLAVVVGDVSVDADFDVDDNCEMVMSFKCRHCSFLAHDKSTLAAHIRHRHVSGGGRRHRHKSSHTNVNSASLVVQDDMMENVDFDVSKIKMNKREIGKEEMPPIPSIPPTPEAYFIMSDGDEEDDENSCQLLLPAATQSLDDDVNKVVNHHQDSSQTSTTTMDRDRDPLEMDDVFLCAECDIVFASKELCCRHMHDIHGLEQFSAEFIQEVIISRRPGEDGETNTTTTEDNTTTTNGENCDDATNKSDKRIMRKRVQPPKYLTLEEGSLVPKKFRVSKTLTHSCSKCLIKYESEQVVKLHETCHIVSEDEQQQQQHNVPKRESNKNGRKRRKSEEEEEDDEDEDSLSVEEVDPSIDSSVSHHDGQRRNKNDGCTQYKFKCPICLSTTTTDPSKEGETLKNKKKKQEESEKNTKGMHISISKFFTKWSSCASHLWREHQVDCELYSCTVCKNFKNYYITKVKDHERLHKPESNYVCNICNKKFKQRHQLTTHQKYHKEKGTRLPPPSESRWYTPKECHICKRVLSDAKCLKKHISAVHKKLKPYCCNICGHMTARKAELKLHVRQHTNEKPFECPHCPFITGDHNSLRKHKLRHGNHRPYSCPCCEYRCIQSSAFKKHMVSIHPEQDDIVFQCQICPHVSVNESVASAHLKDHEEGRIASTTTSSSSRSQTDEDSSSVDRIGGGNNNNVHRSLNEDGNSSSSSNDYPEIGIRSFGRRRRPPPRKAKCLQKRPRWLEQDDSVDVIDTGGVTIPAPPPTTAASTTIAETVLNSSSTPSSSPTQDKDTEVQNNHNDNDPSSTSRRLEVELTTVNIDDIA